MNAKLFAGLKPLLLLVLLILAQCAKKPLTTRGLHLGQTQGTATSATQNEDVSLKFPRQLSVNLTGMPKPCCGIAPVKFNFPNHFSVNLTGLPKPSINQAPVKLSFPNKLSVNLTGLPKQNNTNSSTNNYVLAAIISAAVSLLVTFLNGLRQKQIHESQKNHEESLQSKSQKFKREISENDQIISMLQHFGLLEAEENRTSVEKDKLKHYAGVSDFNKAIELIKLEREGIRIERENRAQFAEILSKYFDKLTSPKRRDRDLALMALSGFDEYEKVKNYLHKMFPNSSY